MMDVDQVTQEVLDKLLQKAARKRNKGGRRRTVPSVELDKALGVNQAYVDRVERGQRAAGVVPVADRPCFVLRGRGIHDCNTLGESDYISVWPRTLTGAVDRVNGPYRIHVHEVSKILKKFKFKAKMSYGFIRLEVIGRDDE